MMVYAVIMAGGSGERFWPYSRMQKPKQLLRLTNSDKTMIEEAIERIAPVIKAENVLIITSDILKQPISDALPSVPANNIIAEPAKRNTAPCLALGASVIKARIAALGESNAVMCVLTADHFIGNNDAFVNDVMIAIETASSMDALVTIGVPPTRPETGYRYIEVANVNASAMKVMQFREKPAHDVALSYMKSGRHLWNSGMFFWRISTFEKALNNYLPEVGAIIDVGAELDVKYKTLPDISIDYGVMEKAPNVFVVPATFPWDDIGSWDSLDRLQRKSADGNVEQGRVVIIDTADTIVVNAAAKGHVVTSVGVQNLVIVATDDAVLVCSKDRAQDVKKIVAALREKGWKEFL